MHSINVLNTHSVLTCSKSTMKRPIYEICFKLTIKTPERNQCHCSPVTIVKFGQVNTVWVILNLSEQDIKLLRVSNLRGTTPEVSTLCFFSTYAQVF